MKLCDSIAIVFVGPTLGLHNGRAGNEARILTLTRQLADERAAREQNRAELELQLSRLKTKTTTLSMKLDREQETRVELEREFRVRTRELRDERQLRVEQAQAIVRLSAASQRQITEIRGNLQQLNVAGNRRDSEMIGITNRVHREWLHFIENDL